MEQGLINICVHIDFNKFEYSVFIRNRCITLNCIHCSLLHHVVLHQNLFCWADFSVHYRSADVSRKGA